MGEDFDGNKYYLYDNGSERPRRMVEYKDDTPDPAKLHMLWSSWLRYTRSYPPTPEEIIKYEQDKVAFAEKVRKLEEADAKLRMQEQLERKLSGNWTAGGGSTPMMTAEQMMQSISASEARQQKHDTAQGASNGPNPDKP